MSLSKQLAIELEKRNGFVAEMAETMAITTADARCEIEILAVDTMSCAVTEIRVRQRTTSSDHAPLSEWGTHLSERLTYLMESVAPLEIDEIGQTALLRSTAMSPTEGSSTYYEIQLEQGDETQTTLRRFAVTDGTRTRTAMHFTHEIVKRLADDLCTSVLEDGGE